MILNMLSRAFEKNLETEVLVARSTPEAQSVIREGFVDLMLADVRLAGSEDSQGLELLTFLKEQSPKTKAIIMTGYGGPDAEKESYRRGAIYYFQKPLDLSVLMDRMVALGVAAPQDAGDTGEPIEVLVVDHSPLIRQFLSAILCREIGMKATVAADPEAALHRLSVNRPDVILLDLDIPRTDAHAFIREITASERIPIVATTCHPENFLQAETLALLEEGAVSVLRKPVLERSAFPEDAAMVLIHSLRRAARARRSHGSASGVEAEVKGAEE